MGSTDVLTLAVVAFAVGMAVTVPLVADGPAGPARAGSGPAEQAKAIIASATTTPMRSEPSWAEGRAKRARARRAAQERERALRGVRGARGSPRPGPSACGRAGREPPAATAPRRRGRRGCAPSHNPPPQPAPRPVVRAPAPPPRRYVAPPPPPPPPPPGRLFDDSG